MPRKAKAKVEDVKPEEGTPSKGEPVQTPLLGIDDVLPTKPLKIDRMTLPLSIFPEDLGVVPDSGLCQSVKAFGVLLPVVVVVRQAHKGPEDVDIRNSYEIHDGRRRIIAARLAGFEHIAVQVMSGEEVSSLSIETGAAMELALHATRRANFLSELEAIEKLAHHYRSAGVAEQTVPSRISRVTGMPVATINQRLKMHTLHPAIQEGLRQGTVSVAAAVESLKLSKPAQARIAAKILDPEGGEGKVTQREVALERKVAVAATAQALPFEELKTLSLADLMGVQRTESAAMLPLAASMFDEAQVATGTFGGIPDSIVPAEHRDASRALMGLAPLGMHGTDDDGVFHIGQLPVPLLEAVARRWDKKKGSERIIIDGHKYEIRVVEIA